MFVVLLAPQLGHKTFEGLGPSFEVRSEVGWATMKLRDKLKEIIK